MLNFIIIDDEADARQLIRDLLLEFTDCTIIGEAESAQQANILLNTQSPDVVFLDIDLKDGTGFDVLSDISNPTFSIIFVTAFNDFAIKAFQYNALDYILKPISSDDMQRVIKKIRQTKPHQNDFQKQLQNLSKSLKAQKHEKLVLSTMEGLHFLPVSEVVYLKSEGSYTTVFTEKKQRIVVSQNIGTFDYLDSNNSDSTFYRIHQSYIVNLKSVRQFLKSEDGDFALLEDNTKIPISRRKKEGFLNAMREIE